MYKVSDNYLAGIAAGNDWANRAVPTDNLPKIAVQRLTDSILPQMLVQCAGRFVKKSIYDPLPNAWTDLNDSNYFVQWPEVWANQFDNGPLNVVTTMTCNTRPQRGLCVNLAQLCQAIAGCKTLSDLKAVFETFFEIDEAWWNSWVSRMEIYSPTFDIAFFAAAVDRFLIDTYGA